MLLPHTCSVFTAAKDFNGDVRGYLVLNMTPTNMFVNEANEAAEVFGITLKCIWQTPGYVIVKHIEMFGPNQ